MTVSPCSKLVESAQKNKLWIDKNGTEINSSIACPGQTDFGICFWESVEIIIQWIISLYTKKKINIMQM